MFLIQTILYLEINLFALTVLLLIYLNMVRRTDRHLPEQKLYLAMIGANALILLFDSLMWLMDGRSGGIIRVFYLFVTACYYALNPVISVLWLAFAYLKTFERTERLRRLLIPLCILPGINLVISFLSMFTGALFLIDENNIYHRGPLCLYMALLCGVYLIISLCMMLSQNRRMEKHSLYPLALFVVPPLVCGVLQFLFYGLSIVWVSATISILIIFINYQNNQLEIDYLTGVFNRRQLDHYLKQLSRNNMDAKLVAGMMIDVDEFKTINDLYGHDAGDEALKIVTKILKRTLRSQDFIARYGGDEFMVVMKIKEAGDLTRAVRRLKENVNRFNARQCVPYTISLSIGYDTYTPVRGTSFLAFVKHLDGLMYEDKLKRTGQMLLRM